jgi:hypothetical protein
MLQSAVIRDDVSHNGETISPFTPASLGAIAAMTESEKSDYITALLRHDEMEAIEVLAPVFRQARAFTDVFKQYRPVILVMRDHFCLSGRRKAGRITWAEVVRIHFGISLRRLQQLLAVPRNGSQNDPERRSRKEEQLDAVILPAIRMAHAVLALDEDSEADPAGILRLAALRALAFELLNALRRSAIRIRVTICPLQPGDVSGLCQMIVRCFGAQLDQVFRGLGRDELRHAVRGLVDKIGSRYQNLTGEIATPEGVEPPTLRSEV